MRISVVLLLFFPALLYAQSILPTTSEHILSTQSPVTANLRDNSLLQERVDRLHRLIRTLGAAIDRRVSSFSPLACNLRGVAWIPAAENLFEANAFGTLDETCATRFDVNPAILSGEISPSAASDAPAIIHDASDALGAGMGKFVDAFESWGSSVDWSRGWNAVRAWEISRRNQRCAVEAVVAFRVAGEWYLRAAVTNHAVDAFVPNGQRAFVEEFVRQNLKPALQLQREKWGEDGTALNGTTVLTVTGGKAEFGLVPIGVDENPALAEALMLNERAVDQAKDAITPSNIAILALPMVMSLLPVAFVADLNTCGTLLYIVLTDLVASLPFLIKGIELVHTGTALRGEIVAYHIGTSDLGLLEVWSASCHGEGSFRMLGSTFICFAISAMVLGLVLEIVAFHVMRSRRRRHRGRKLRSGESTGPFGDALLVESRPDDLESDAIGDLFDDDTKPSIWAIVFRKFGFRRRPEAAPWQPHDEPFPEPTGPVTVVHSDERNRWS